jgi:ubiquinone/menaquinone biosynthesis C-methylase UbiE
MLKSAGRKPEFSAARVEMDALRIPFGSQRFDAVLCGFGMRNLDQLAAGVAEVHRLLKPGGVFVTLEFFRPRTAFTRFFYRVPAPVFLPLGGWLLGSRREAYAYLAGSVLGFRSAEEYAALCRAGGFSRVEVAACDFGIAHIVRAVKEG